PGAKRPPLMGSELVSRPGVGVLLILRGVLTAEVGLFGLDVGAMVSPSKPASFFMRVVLVSELTAWSHDEQNLALAEICISQLEQNIEGGILLLVRGVL